jgi:transposase
MNEQRFVVTDPLWQRFEPHLPGKTSDAGPRQRIIASSLDKLTHLFEQSGEDRNYPLRRQDRWLACQHLGARGSRPGYPRAGRT